MPRSVPLDDVRPTQLYLNGRKLALATEWFDFDIPGTPGVPGARSSRASSGAPNYDPLPVAELDGDLVLTDGHTRAFLAWVAGADELRVRPETDDLDWPVYRRCLEWCREEDVTHVGDLASRAVDADTFEEVWVDRCQRAAERLASDGQ